MSHRADPSQPSALSRRALAALLLAAALPVAAQQPPGQVDVNGQAAGLPSALGDVGFDQKLGDPLPLDVTFRDASGEPVRLGDYFHRGKPVILVPVYFECPMLCDLTMSGLASSLKPLTFSVGDEFEVVVFSFDPGETPATATTARRRYLPLYGRAGTDAGWHFLTGEPAAIDRLTAAIGFRYHYDAERDQFAHAAGLVMATEDGEIARYFFGTDHTPKDLRLGLIEASNREIGTPVDQVLLYCFHYDPTLGRYSAATMNLVRLGGVITLLMLGGSIALMLRRDRRRSRRRVEPQTGN